MDKRLKHWCIHLGRVAMLAGILVTMHYQHRRLVAIQRFASQQSVPLDRVKKFFPTATECEAPHQRGGWFVKDVDAHVLGYVVQTAPDSDPFVGFSGPTNVLIAFNPKDRILGVEILASGDTRDHVDLVRKNNAFWQSWRGLTWDEAAAHNQFDGVAGATLTTMAMVQGIQRRLGSVEVMAKFATPLKLDDAKQLFENAADIQQDKDLHALWRVFDASQVECGSILRTSPAADAIVGYQGPTETRIALAPGGVIVGIAIAGSFDNEPYVGYVRADSGFAELLRKYTLKQWSQLDLKEEGIEGVSGATMTSMAIAQGLIETARRFDSDQKSSIDRRSGKSDALWRSLGTVVIVVAGLLIGLTSLRGNSKVRVAYQIVLVLFLGFMNADLISMAMLVGWAQSGVPVQNALGLVSLSAAAIALPIAARTNVYCSHLCAHGAVQQLMPRRWKATSPPPAWLLRCLTWIRPALLVWVVLVGTLGLTYSLVDVEPFDAYAWRAAAWPTIAIAVVGIVASWRIPMAYCRFGCPTGAVLNYLRRNAKSDRLTRADWFAAACLGIGILLCIGQRFPANTKTLKSENTVNDAARG
ncbi:MAG: FMN-binding protein [Pirellula sp.]